ncbi:related to mitotic checkpoint protein BUB3 [Sporisorium reilianum f. sp. reilianum]|uniref:Related to mitotic checkpoint protein BUB3 n=1 Tax=Sporisorium reilianum f. sp. reilianum TaxID=72559 RepID=A0A2N8UIN4_9BASI|nr:related to mitotic checkpoint protein BUB3 [Sporisorium reilianum f. sp. reilianum]
MSRPTSSRSSPAAPATDIHFPDPPQATVSAVVFSPTPASSTTDVLASSWDHNVHHYRIDTASPTSSEAIRKVQTFAHEAPVLDVCFITDTLAASASVDRRVRLLDLATGKALIVGKHDDSVLKVRWCAATKMLISGSADRSVCFWDAGLDGAPALLKRLEMPDKVLAMDVSPPFPATGTQPVHSASRPGSPHARDDTPRLVVAMAGRHVYVYDLLPLRSAIERALAAQPVPARDWQPDQRRESSLKFMARDLRCMAAGDGYAMSSIEGRIAVEFFDPSTRTQAMKYAFKCHRATVAGDAVDDDDEMDRPYDVVFPVHAVAFHPRHGTFASLGGDAVVSVWDAAAKKRIRQYPKFDAPVTAGCFDAAGALLCLATGSDAVQPDARVATSLILKPGAWDECQPKLKSKSGSGKK